ncbi:MAG: GNAT family N-acetyltransferase [Rhizobiaceae bacterium]
MTILSVADHGKPSVTTTVERPAISALNRTPVDRVSPAIRQMTSLDIEMLSAFYDNLSDRSRYARFMTPFAQVPSSLLRSLANVETPHHVAFMATSSFKAQTTMVGEVRFATRDGDDSTAEFAIAVADPWQGKGVARKLLQVMENAARDRGVRTLVGTTLRSNLAMIELARRAGYRLKPDPDEARAVRLMKQISTPFMLH